MCLRACVRAHTCVHLPFGEVSLCLFKNVHNYSSVTACVRRRRSALVAERYDSGRGWAGGRGVRSGAASPPPLPGPRCHSVGTTNNQGWPLGTEPGGGATDQPGQDGMPGPFDRRCSLVSARDTKTIANRALLRQPSRGVTVGSKAPLLFSLCLLTLPNKHSSHQSQGDPGSHVNLAPRDGRPLFEAHSIVMREFMFLLFTCKLIMFIHWVWKEPCTHFW